MFGFGYHNFVPRHRNIWLHVKPESSAMNPTPVSKSDDAPVEVPVLIDVVQERPVDRVEVPFTEEVAVERDWSEENDHLIPPNILLDMWRCFNDDDDDLYIMHFLGHQEEVPLHVIQRLRKVWNESRPYSEPEAPEPDPTAWSVLDKLVDHLPMMFYVGVAVWGLVSCGTTYVK